MRLKLLTLAAAVIVLGACSAEPSPDETRTPSPDMAVAEASSPDASPTPSPVPEADPALGTTQDIHGGGTAAAIEYSQPVAADSPPPSDAGYPDDFVWGGLNIEVCVPSELPEDVEGYYVTRSPWSLMYETGALLQTSSTGYNGFPQPEYPWGDTAVRPGQCVSGWIVFPVPADETPTGVQYEAHQPPNLYWQISAE